MSVEGRVVRSRHDPVQTELTAAAAEGATTLHVDWAALFSDADGMLVLNDVEYEYETSDEDESTVTLYEPGLEAAAAAGDPVYVMDGDQVLHDYILEVDLGDGDPVDVPIPFEQRDLWTPAEYADPIRVTIAEDHSALVTVPQRRPIRSADYIDPETLPDPVDTVPPVESPALFANGLLETFILYTAPVEAYRTLLTYQVSTDYDPGTGIGTWTDLPEMPTRDQVLATKVGPDGNPWTMGTTYAFRVVASNGAGSAPPSAAVQAALSATATTLVAEQVVTALLVAGYALLGQVSVGGTNFTLTPPGVDPTNLPGGLLIRFLNGGVIHLPADGITPARFSGDVVAGFLDVINGMNLGGVSYLNGLMWLRDTDIPDPDVPPTAETVYDTLALPPTSPVGLVGSILNADGWVVYDYSSQYFLEYDSAGVQVNSRRLLHSGKPVYGVAAVNLSTTGKYVQVQATGTGSSWQVRVSKYDSNWNLPGGTGTTLAAYPVKATPYTVVVGSGGGTSFYLAIDNEDGTHTVTQHSATYPYAQLDADVVTFTAGPLGALYVGDLDGAARIVAHPLAGDALVFDLSGTPQASETWPRPVGADVRGLATDGTDLWHMTPTGVLRHRESGIDQPGGLVEWAYEWTDDDTHHTMLSPEYEYATVKCSKTLVTASPPPQLAEVEDHSANRVRIYAAEGGPFYEMTDGPLAVGTYVLDAIVSEVGTGTESADANNFGTVPGSAGTLAAKSGSFFVDGLSGGDVGDGDFAESIRDRVIGDTTKRGAVELATLAEGYALARDDVALTPLSLYQYMVDFYWGLVGYTGTLYESKDPTLTALAAVTTAANKLIYATGADTFATTDLSAFIRTLLDDGDASAALTTLGVTTFAKSLLDDADADTALTTLGVSTFAKTLLDDAAATNVLTTLGVSAFIKTLLDDADATAARTTLGAQAASTDLAAIAALTSAANKIAYATGAGTWALADLTAFARTMLDDADAGAVLTTLGISAFVKTILDDADASAVLSTLGVSTFIKTLLDDADAATARATLGAQAQDATLDGLAAVALNVADRVPYTTAADTFSAMTVTTFARTLLNDVDNTEARATLAAAPLRYPGSTITAAGAYTLVLADELVTLYFNSASAQSIELPLLATLTVPATARFRVVRLGAGALTIAPAAGATLNGRTSAAALASVAVDRYGEASFYRRTGESWLVFGDFT